MAKMTLTEKIIARAAGLDAVINEYDVGTAWGKTEDGDFQSYVSYITSDTNDQDFLASIQADYTGGSGACSTIRW